MKARLAIAVVGGLLLAAATAGAHDEFRIIGTITAAQPTQLQVKSREGKTLAIKVNDETRPRGLEVLLHQAVAQVALMTGRPGPVAEMRAALLDAVAARA